MNLTSVIVLATYNGERFIEEQLDSILTQTRKPDKIIISDDNSNDDTVNICEKILSKSNIPFSILKHEKNIGVTQNFLKGIALANEDIIFFSDQDDIWKPNKIEMMMSIFENDVSCQEVLCNALLFDENTVYPKYLKDQLGNNFPFDKDGFMCKNELHQKMILGNYATGMCMAFRQIVMNEINLFLKNNSIQYILHDVLINLFCTIEGKVYYISEPLVMYRQHDKNVVGVNQKKNLKVFLNMEKRLNISMKKEKEKLLILNYLNDKYCCFDNENFNLLKLKNKFIKAKGRYIDGGNTIALIKLIHRHHSFYSNYLLSLRELVICIKNRIGW